jgi:diacylglycerol kinase (ATP)
VTSLVACGGDGTVNLVARVAVKANLPMGILPMGGLNNIAVSLYGSDDPDLAIARAVGRNYRKIDTALAAGQMFIGSVGIGFACQMTELLAGRKRPRFCLGWSNLAAKAAAGVDPKTITMKIDAFRFEAHPTLLNVNLLCYSFGLPVSPVSVADDGTAEVIFNLGLDSEPLSTFARQVCRKKYIYGSSVKLFRGKEVSFEPARGTRLCYDGEIMDLTCDRLDISVGTTQLKVFC